MKDLVLNLGKEAFPSQVERDNNFSRLKSSFQVFWSGRMDELYLPLLKSSQPKSQGINTRDAFCIWHENGRFHMNDSFGFLVKFMKNIFAKYSLLPYRPNMFDPTHIWWKHIRWKKTYLMKNIFAGKPRVHFGQGQVVWGSEKVGTEGGQTDLSNNSFRYFL